MNGETKRIALAAIGLLAISVATVFIVRRTVTLSVPGNVAASPGAAQGSLFQSGVATPSRSAITGDPDIFKKIVRRHDEQMAARHDGGADTAAAPGAKPPPQLNDLMEPEPGVKKFRATSHVTSIAPGETIIMGGWSTEAGQRILVFVTPSAVDPAGNKAAGPFGAQTEIQIDSKFVSASDKAFEKAGLQTLLTDQNDSKEAIRCSDSEFRSYINALEQSAGCDVLAAPRVTTTQGCQAFLQIPDTVMIAGVSHAVGLSLDVLPALSADGASVDLTSIARYTTPDPDALDATGQ